MVYDPGESEEDFTREQIMQGEARKASNELIGLLKPVAGTTALVSSWVSFLAFQDMFASPDFSELITMFSAGAAAVGSWFLLYYMNLSIFHGILAVDREQRGRVLRYVPVAALLIAGFSTYPNVMTTAGSNALELHRERDQSQLEILAGQAQGLSLSVSQLAPPLIAKGSEYQELGRCENESGCLTGAPGPGDLTLALQSASDVLEGTAATIYAAQDNISAMVPTLHASIQSGDLVQARASIATMIAAVPFSQINQAADRLEQGLGIEGKARRADVRERQNQAIAQIEKDLQSFAVRMRTSAQELQQQLSTLVVPMRQPVTKAGAILRGWDQLIPQISLGLALDWALPLIALLIASIRDTIPRDPTEPASLANTDFRAHVDGILFVNEQNERLREALVAQHRPPDYDDPSVIAMQKIKGPRQ